MRGNKPVKKFFYIIAVVMLLLLASGALFALRVRGSTVVHPKQDIYSGVETVFYRQDDTLWAEKFMGDTSYIMEKSGCLVSCIASAITMSGGTEETPDGLNVLFSKTGVYDGEANVQWGTLDDIPHYGVQVYQQVSEEILMDCLSEGRFPIVRVRMAGVGNFHYVLITEARDGMFYCMDPLKEGLRPLSQYGNRIYAVRCVYFEE